MAAAAVALEVVGLGLLALAFLLTDIPPARERTLFVFDVYNISKKTFMSLVTESTLSLHSRAKFLLFLGTVFFSGEGIPAVPVIEGR